MTTFRVDSRAGLLLVPGGDPLPCAIGRSGTVAAGDKREGDGATPIGTWPFRGILLRRDRIGTLPAGISLPWRWIREDDGWSDDPRDPVYNRPVRHPHAYSAERLWREDELYDIVVVLGHNDAPPLPAAGSAIFLHCRKPDRPTEGCVAVEAGMLAGLLARIEPGDGLAIG